MRSPRPTTPNAVRVRLRTVAALGLATSLGASLLVAPAAQADGDIVLECDSERRNFDTFRALVPGSTEPEARYSATGSNGARTYGVMYLDADPDTEVGDWYLGGWMDLLRGNGLTPPYTITVTGTESDDVLAEGSIGECGGGATGLVLPRFPASDAGRWAEDLPSNDYMGWRHEDDGSLTAVAKGDSIWSVYTQHSEYQHPTPQEFNLGMPPGSEEQLRFHVFMCGSWGGDDSGFHVWASGPGVEEHVTLQYANRDGGWLDVAGAGGWPVPEGFVWPAWPSPMRYPLSHAPGLMWSNLDPSDGPVSLRALDPDGRVVGQRTYDNYCGVTFDPATWTVVDVPTAETAEDGSWVVPADDATYQWTLEADGDLVVRLLPLLSSFPDGAVTHNFGQPADLPPAGSAPVVTRTWGESRYGTAAALALENYAPGQEVVYLATGLTFPDALAGAALAGQQSAPVLLTHAERLPSDTRAALTALDPDRVVVLGGETAVSGTVLDAVTDLGLDVTRLAGDNRYETAALVSGQLESADAVYVASGLDYPDALAAAGVAGASADPVLLTKQDSLPQVAVRELLRHDPEVVYLLGGTVAVSSAVEQQIEDLGLQVTRVWGENRYGTAEAVAGLLGDGFDQAWVASGADFADALSAAPLAGREDGVVLLTRPAKLPRETGDALLLGAPQQVTVMGGPVAVEPSVEQDIADLPWVR